MTTCKRCGAALALTVNACPYCGLTTPLGEVAHHRAEFDARGRAHSERVAASQAEEAARVRVAKLASQALLWSAAGTALCCLPLGLVGAAQAAQTRSLARSQNVALPARVAVAFWLGIASCMLSTAVATWAFVDSRHERHRVAARTAQLEREIGAGASAPTLARAVACALAEQRALKVGYDGEPGERLDDFTCVGRFAAGTDSASLEDFSFRYSSTTFNVSTCFKRGAIWYVSDMRTGACPTGVPVAGPAASAGALPGGPASAAGKQPN